MKNPILLRPESSPGRFEVWEVHASRKPTLEEVHKTAEDAMHAARALFAEWASCFVCIDTWQADHESQCFYRVEATYRPRWAHTEGQAHQPEREDGA